MTAGDVRIVDARTPEERDRPFLPGMRTTWLMPFYDGLSRLSGVGELHDRTVELADLGPGQVVLDVGCGTGNLTLSLVAAQPDARVTGLDPDGAALRCAARKARRRGASLTLVQGYADRLPAEDASLDHVVSSLALHHLDDEARLAFAREAFRSLRSGGRITIADFGGPAQATDAAGHASHHHRPGHALLHLPRLLRSRVQRGPERAHALGDGVPLLLAGAGFVEAREVGHVDHRYGRAGFVQAIRP
ncbi:MAG TPA: class I SAM-dependent methyltransferase [Nocardioides sp.]|uniref:class I SAM-dependent methyltransferase n=1 Tax=Nocardioides sp. TaxID=35761 RepID=UPI002F41FE50